MKLESLKPGRYSGAILAAAALESAGITHAFGIPGTHNLELYDALIDSAVIPVLVTDEQSAGFMADGMWRSGGPMACVNLVPGAGLTQALSGIAEAYMDGVPLLVLMCGIRNDLPYRFQLHAIDQKKLVEPVVKGIFACQQGPDIPDAVLQAVHLAQCGVPGPVAVEIPANLFLTRHPWEPNGKPLFPASSHPAFAISTSEVKEAARLLTQSRRPLLYVGLGARGAAGLLLPLAERLGAVVATTFSAKGLFPETHPLWLWPGFSQACPAPLREIASSCDSVLILGARMGEVSTASYGLSLPSTSIQVDIDPGVLGVNFPVSLPIQSDCRQFVEALLVELELQRDSFLLAGLKADLVQAHAKVRQDQHQTGSQGVNPAFLMAELQFTFPADTIYVADSGNATFLAVEHLRLGQSGGFLAPTDFSCMGYAIPAAIGAALAHPGRPVVAFCGDGALLMTGLEILTAVHQGLPLTVFVLRNGTLGQIAAFQQASTQRPVCSDLPDFDLKALAAACGADWLSLPANPQIVGVLAEAFNRSQGQSRPVFIEVALDESRATYFTRGVVSTNFHRLEWPDRIRLVSRAIRRKLLSPWGP